MMRRTSSFELLLGCPRGLVLVEAMVIGVTGLYIIYIYIYIRNAP